MRKIILAMLIISFLSSCGGGKSDKKTGDDKKETGMDNTKDPDYQKGLDLISRSDCFTCHKIDELVTGPSYRDVAKKYAGQDTAVSYLAGKIISGGNGVWGEVFMTPHSGVSTEDAEAMAKYILLLDKK
ncbi:MAG: c-type cytochrome [Bacteroidota bacterium]